MDKALLWFISSYAKDKGLDVSTLVDQRPMTAEDAGKADPITQHVEGMKEMLYWMTEGEFIQLIMKIIEAFLTAPETEVGDEISAMPIEPTLSDTLQQEIY